MSGDVVVGGAMKYVHALFALSVALVGAASSRADPAPASSEPVHEIVVTDDDMGKTVNLGPDDILVVQLRSNPTTGSSWYTVLSPSSLITLVGHSYTEDPHPPGYAGVGGVEEFRFRPTSAASMSYQSGEWFRMLNLRSFDRGVTGAPLWEIRILEGEIR